MKKIGKTLIFAVWGILFSLPVIATAAPDKTANAVGCLEQILVDLRQNRIGFNQ